ncbi:MAG: LLM class flavin-dependent oxidoreductase [Anaerolineae bacterium]|nr:LLM class flavin-dependent oxidoreductase [Anaerolineae bacterium]NUQ04294.1 LLM class flavin-dependent oxidoreductase [Anaerolineae bacterium]
MSRPRQISIALQTSKSAAEYVALARLIDTYPFDGVTVYCDAPYHPGFAPLLLMAPHLRRARLGVAAISPARVHPIDIAAQAALLADLAAGGVYIGLARGAWLRDHGIAEHAQPIRQIGEAAAVIRMLLEGRSGGYDGAIYRIAPHVRAPYPLPGQSIPLLIGSWGRRLCALAGEIADEVKVGGSANPDVVPVIHQYTAKGRDRAGRAPDAVGVVIGAVTVCDEDRALARQTARRSVALYLPVVALLDPTVQVDPALVARLQAAVEADRLNDAAALISDDLLEKFAFAGDPDDLIRQTEALFAAGASRVEFGTPHGIPSANGIRLLGERVIPVLQRGER